MSRNSTHSIIIANDLRSGRIVYFTENSSWSESITDAELLADKSAEQRLVEATADERDNLVIDPNLAEIAIDADTAAKVQLTSIREQIRASGPTILAPGHASTSQAA